MKYTFVLTVQSCRVLTGRGYNMACTHCGKSLQPGDRVTSKRSSRLATKQIAVVDDVHYYCEKCTKEMNL